MWGGALEWEQGRHYGKEGKEPLLWRQLLLPGAAGAVWVVSYLRLLNSTAIGRPTARGLTAVPSPCRLIQTCLMLPVPFLTGGWRGSPQPPRAREHLPQNGLGFYGIFLSPCRVFVTTTDICMKVESMFAGAHLLRLPGEEALGGNLSSLTPPTWLPWAPMRDFSGL